MRKLLIALAMLPALAQADVIMETANKGGGKIVLTDEYCNDSRFRIAYTMTPETETVFGCWTADDSFIHIKWDGGRLRSYDYSGWIVKKNKKTNL